MSPVPVLRDRDLRPTLRQVAVRGVVVTLVDGVALWLLAWVLPRFAIDSFGEALLAGLVLGFVNAVVWPAVAVLVVPLSVLTLGLGAVVLDALVVGLVLDRLPGVHIDGVGTILLVTLGLAVVTALLSAVLAVDDDAWFDRSMARRARRRAVAATDVPGTVFVQLDGLSEPVLRRALAGGDVPTLRRWIDERTHRITPWEPEWSCQTGGSQCGILHGDVTDMPAFRWIEKGTGTVLVSNRPKAAAEIERRHGGGPGLLAGGGSSYGNLFTGGAARAALTMSVAGQRKEGRIGAGYGRYFARPDNATRTLTASVVEILRERGAAMDQRRRDVRPRIERSWGYAFLRTFTTVVSRDVCLQGVLNDMAEGSPAIYVDFVGYDEVAHHSGPERADTVAVLRDLDRQIRRIDRSRQWAPRPYHVVVLSDHGQTQGEPFAEHYGESLAQVVARLCGSAASGDPDAEEGRTESTAWLRHAEGRRGRTERAAPPAAATVLASGNLGLVYLAAAPRRMTLEEIEAAHPDLVPGLLAHPGIGFVLVRSAVEGALVLGAAGRHCLATGMVTGTDPLGPFGPQAAAQVAVADAYPSVADLMVNSAYDSVTGEVNAFEHQVGSHGGMGGDQQRPFVLHPADLPVPAEPIRGPVALHQVLMAWRPPVTTAPPPPPPPSAVLAEPASP